MNSKLTNSVLGTAPNIFTNKTLLVQKGKENNSSCIQTLVLEINALVQQF